MHKCRLLISVWIGENEMEGFVKKKRAICSAKTDQQKPATHKWITAVEFNCDISEEGTLSDHIMFCLKLYGLIWSNYVVALNLMGVWRVWDVNVILILCPYCLVFSIHTGHPCVIPTPSSEY